MGATSGVALLFLVAALLAAAFASLRNGRRARAPARDADRRRRLLLLPLTFLSGALMQLGSRPAGSGPWQVQPGRLGGGRRARPDLLGLGLLGRSSVVSAWFATRAFGVYQRSSDSLKNSAASFAGDGHLLPPLQPRDRRLVLQLRQPDLPGLHDADAGRHALPGLREAEDAGRGRCSRWPSIRSRPVCRDQRRGLLRRRRPRAPSDDLPQLVLCRGPYGVAEGEYGG